MRQASQGIPDEWDTALAELAEAEARIEAALAILLDDDYPYEDRRKDVIKALTGGREALSYSEAGLSIHKALTGGGME